jgi:hypothetical protein
VELEESAKVETVLEREPLKRLAREGQLAVFGHVRGTGVQMDTMRERGSSKKSGRATRLRWKVW